jgi:hypothetical protein
MNGFNISLFCTQELGLIKFYLKQAVEKSSLKSLKEIDYSESQKLVFEFGAIHKGCPSRWGGVGGGGGGGGFGKSGQTRT